MNYVDLVVAGVALISVLIGVLRGFVREMLSLASWILAFYVAFAFREDVAELINWGIDTPGLRVAAAFAALFVAVLLAASIASYFLYRLIPVRAFRGPDRALGAVYGFARAVVLVAAAALVAGATALSNESWWEESRALHHVQPLVEMMTDLLPEDVAREVRHVPTPVPVPDENGQALPEG